MENSEMQGSSAKKSISLEGLVADNMNINNDLKEKLKDIIKVGKDYDADVSDSIKNLIHNADQEIVLLCIQAVSELVKAEDKNEVYAQKNIIEPILKIMEKDFTMDQLELIQQCTRAIGNFCSLSHNNTARKVILECNGVPILKKLLEKCHENAKIRGGRAKICQVLSNFGIGGQEFCKAIIEQGIPDLVHKILSAELSKDDFDDDTVSSALYILIILNNYIPEMLHSDEINKDVLNVLIKTTNMEISEMCLEHLHYQVEYDSVKTFICKEGGVLQICERLELLIQQQEARQLISEDSLVETVIKQACDLIVIISTGDEARDFLFQNATGVVYEKMLQWLRSPNPHLVKTAAFSIGNFAREDEYCVRLVADKTYDVLLDIFDEHWDSVSEESSRSVCAGALGALRNLSVSELSKRAAPARAAALLVAALPDLSPADPQLAYKLLAATRMLVHKQPHVARQLAASRAALRGAAGGGAGGGAAAAEAGRLLAWTVRELRHDPVIGNIVQAEGCIACIMNMLLTSHSLMQNEAILALTLLAIDALLKNTPGIEPDFDYAKSFTTQVISSEIGKHIAILVDTNCAKMPIEVAENLIAFLEITSKKNEICLEFKEAKVHESLKKFAESRNDLSEDLKVCIANILKAISHDED